MTISMYSAAVPVCQSMLRNLSHLLEKGQAYAVAKKCDESALTQFRLAPDMFAFTRQVLIACDAAKNGVARLAGIEAPKFADDEKTFAELKLRIQKTLDFLATVEAASVDGSEDKEITFPAGPDVKRTMRGQQYLTQWMLPNLYFHITTAYNILRHNSVDVGKLDYLLGARD